MSVKDKVADLKEQRIAWNNKLTSLMNVRKQESGFIRDSTLALKKIRAENAIREKNAKTILNNHKRALTKAGRDMTDARKKIRYYEDAIKRHPSEVRAYVKRNPFKALESSNNISTANVSLNKEGE